MRSILKASEKHLRGISHWGGIWEASERHISLRRHLGGIWEAYLVEETSERHLRGFWEASERHLKGIWEASGRRRHLRGIWRHKLNLLKSLCSWIQQMEAGTNFTRCFWRYHSVCTQPVDKSSKFRKGTDSNNSLWDQLFYKFVW